MIEAKCSKCGQPLFIAYVPICLYCSRDRPEGALSQLKEGPFRRRLPNAIQEMTILELEKPIQRILRIYRAAGLLGGDPDGSVLRIWMTSLERSIRTHLVHHLASMDRQRWLEAQRLFASSRTPGKPREWMDRPFLVAYVALMEKCVGRVRARMRGYLETGQTAAQVLADHDRMERELIEDAVQTMYRNRSTRERARVALLRAARSNDAHAVIRKCVRGKNLSEAHAELHASILVHQAEHVGHPDLAYGINSNRHDVVHYIQNLLLGRDGRGKRKVSDDLIARKLVALRVPLSEKAILKLARERGNKPQNIPD